MVKVVLLKYVVRLFAGLTDEVGGNAWSCQDQCPIRGSELKRQFFADFPNLAYLEPGTRLAVNQSFVAWDCLIEEGDEVAFIPPVSGG